MRLLLTVIFGIICAVALWLVGCSAASVTESYERTPMRVESIGEGITEYTVIIDDDGIIHLCPVVEDR